MPSNVGTGQWREQGGQEGCQGPIGMVAQQLLQERHEELRVRGHRSRKRSDSWCSEDKGAEFQGVTMSGGRLRGGPGEGELPGVLWTHHGGSGKRGSRSRRTISEVKAKCDPDGREAAGPAGSPLLGRAVPRSRSPALIRLLARRVAPTLAFPLSVFGRRATGSVPLQFLGRMSANDSVQSLNSVSSLHGLCVAPAAARLCSAC